jgi:hypothetical protein
MIARTLSPCGDPLRIFAKAMGEERASKSVRELENSRNNMGSVGRKSAYVCVRFNEFGARNS